MKSITQLMLLLVSAAILHVSSSAQDTTYHLNDRVFQIYTLDTNEDFHNIYISFDVVHEGVLDSGFYEHGIKEGVWKEGSSYYTYENGVKEGFFYKFHYDDSICGYYKNDQLHGDVETWDYYLEELVKYKNGEAYWRESYYNIWASKSDMFNINKGPMKGEDRHGDWKTLTPSGELIGEYTYKNGELIAQTTFHPNGKKKALIEYEKGEESYVKFYDRNGEYMGDFKPQWPREGVFIEFYDNGARSETYFEESIEYMEQDFDSLGNKTSYQRYYESLNQYKTFWNDGTVRWSLFSSEDRKEEIPEYYTAYRDEDALNKIPSVSATITEGKIEKIAFNGYKMTIRESIGGNASFETNDKSGNLYATGQVEKGVPEGVWELYYSSGQLNKSFEFDQGLPNRLFLNYDDDGELLDSIHFKDGLRDGTCLSYYPVRDNYVLAEYLKGEKNGSYIEYNRFGDTLIHGQYIQDKEEGLWSYIVEYSDSPYKNKKQFRTYENGNVTGPSYYEGDYPNRYVTYSHWDYVGVILEYDKDGHLTDSALVHNNWIYYRPNHLIPEDSKVKKYYKPFESNPFNIDLEAGQYGEHKVEDVYNEYGEEYFTVLQVDSVANKLLTISKTTRDWKGVSGHKNFLDTIDKVFYADGVLMRIAKNDLKEEYYYNGQIKVRRTSPEYGQVWDYSFFLPNGHLLTEGHYLEGEPTGNWKWQNETGDYVFEWNFDNQEIDQYDYGEEPKAKEGTWLEWGEENYELMSIKNYQNDLLHGVVVDFYSFTLDNEFLNQPVRISHYVEGELHGEETVFNRYGEKVQTTTYVHGEEKQSKEYPKPHMIFRDSIKVDEVHHVDLNFVLVGGYQKYRINLVDGSIDPVYNDEYSRAKSLKFSNDGRYVYQEIEHFGDLHTLSYQVVDLLDGEGFDLWWYKGYGFQFVPGQEKFFKMYNKELFNERLGSDTIEGSYGYILYDFSGDPEDYEVISFSGVVPLSQFYIGDSIFCEIFDEKLIYRNVETFQKIDSIELDFKFKQGISYVDNIVVDDNVLKIDYYLNPKASKARKGDLIGVYGRPQLQPFEEKFFDLETKSEITIPKKLKGLKWYKSKTKNEIYFVDSLQIYTYNIGKGKYSKSPNLLKTTQNIVLTPNDEWFYFGSINYHQEYNWSIYYGTEQNVPLPEYRDGWYNQDFELVKTLNDTHLEPLSIVDFNSENLLKVVSKNNALGDLNLSTGHMEFLVQKVDSNTVDYDQGLVFAEPQYVDNYSGGSFGELHLKDGKQISMNTSSVSFENPLYKHAKGRLVRWGHFSNGADILYCEDGYYLANGAVEDVIRFQMRGESFPMEQFDLKYNRPDLILDRLGYSDSSLIQAYHAAYKKRLDKLGFTEEMLKEDFHLPEVEIMNINNLPGKTDENEIDLNLHLHDDKYLLDRLFVWVNNVPVFGQSGIPLRDLETQDHSINLKVKLTSGVNDIQVAVMNQSGAESYKKHKKVECTASEEAKDLYVISIGASKYQQEKHNLSYAAKDALDIASQFNKSGQYAQVYSKTLTDTEVTKEEIENLKSYLEKAQINDHVILFVAGHGVFDADLNYYIASYDMDFDHPEENGVPFEVLEDVLDGIKPLHKLMLIDACHSGEIDKEEMEAELLAAEENTSDIVFRDAGYSAMPKLGMQNSFNLMKGLFADLRRGTGATIISSAGGVELAMESDQWQNGLFTYVILEGITSSEADLNDDGEIWLSELQEYVELEVLYLSGGKQHPTSRIENRVLDYRVW